MYLHFLKTISAVDGATLRRIKRHGCDFAAGSTFGRHYDVMAFAVDASLLDIGQSLVLRFFARFAAFRWVCEPFCLKEVLFARSPREWCAAIYALDVDIDVARRLADDLLSVLL